MKYRKRAATIGGALVVLLALLGCQTKQPAYLDSMDSQIDCVRDPECQSGLTH